ncbi:MAG: antitoxin, partial [Nitrososphaerota archaeon]|nr:antitoxin [Nitrososphaerota archaeon]
MHIIMVKIISIRDDVYEELSKRKKDRSFSLVIRE